MGRILDSAMVLVSGAIGLNRLPSAVILGADLGGVALIILLMALGGDLNLSAAEALPAPETMPNLSPEETLARMRVRYDLTPRETEVLRELVLTEDKQTVICERLNIQVKTLQDYVTRLYRKTGAATRAGLTDLYHESRGRT
jgi:DNA-binding NarL/FixJ family response regulator